MGYRTLRVTMAVFQAGNRLVRPGGFASLHQLLKVAILHSAGRQSVLTPGTVAAFPRPEGPKSVRVRTYLSNTEDKMVRKRFGKNIGSAANEWVWLVSQGVAALGTAALMDGHVHRGPAPGSVASPAHRELGASRTSFSVWEPRL